MKNNKFTKTEIESDFKELNSFIEKKLADIEIKYGKAIILVQLPDTFTIKCVIKEECLKR